MTKDTDERVAKYAITLSKVSAGKRPAFEFTPDVSAKISESKRGDLNPAKRLEVRRKISESILAFYAANPSALETRKPSGINQFSGAYTSIEEPVAGALILRGVPFQHNARVGRYFPDFLILENVIIECDGEYWHRDKRKECRRDDYLHRHGYYVFHLSESRILDNAQRCVDMVLGVMCELVTHPGASGFQCQELPFAFAEVDN